MAFERATASDHSALRVLNSFERHVLKPADAAAIEEVLRAMRFVAVGTAAARGPTLSALISA
ncbi:hypothetical protein NL436_27410, partial [Klebsiella pneumoniae]|nr:hypothetical protein [Klebsiella pneumoniae]